MLVSEASTLWELLSNRSDHLNEQKHQLVVSAVVLRTDCEKIKPTATSPPTVLMETTGGMNDVTSCSQLVERFTDLRSDLVQVWKRMRLSYPEFISSCSGEVTEDDPQSSQGVPPRANFLSMRLWQQRSDVRGHRVDVNTLIDGDSEESEVTRRNEE